MSHVFWNFECQKVYFLIHPFGAIVLMNNAVFIVHNGGKILENKVEL